MKKIFTLLLSITAALCLCGSALSQDAEMSIDYGMSDFYSRSDISQAAQVVLSDFSSWCNDCRMDRIAYSGDDAANYLKNSLYSGTPNNDYMVLHGAFHTSKTAQPSNYGFPYLTMEKDDEYVWDWFMTRSKGGEWKIKESNYFQFIPISQKYPIETSPELTYAWDVIVNEVSAMDGVKNLLIEYMGDKFSSNELNYVNILGKGTFDECLVFRVWLRSPKTAYGAWEANTLYAWTWYLARNNKGQWQTITYGY